MNKPSKELVAARNTADNKADQFSQQAIKTDHRAWDEVRGIENWEGMLSEPSKKSTAARTCQHDKTFRRGKSCVQCQDCMHELSRIEIIERLSYALREVSRLEAMEKDDEKA